MHKSIKTLTVGIFIPFYQIVQSALTSVFEESVKNSHLLIPLLEIFGDFNASILLISECNV